MVATTFDYSGARVLVTGGSNGIGLGIATAFRDAGAEVAITGTRGSAGEYDHDLSGFAYHPCRLPDPGAVDAVAAALPGLDVLVNNAGQNLPGGRSEYDPAVFEEVVAVNLFSAFRMASACRPLLEASTVDGGASLVNLGSMASYFGIEFVPGYGAAKAGVVQMTKTLAVAWARHGIRVNAVAPGVIETNMTAIMMPHDAITKPILERTPMRRFGTPADIAPVVLFLASPAARYVTGQTLPVDGGFSVQG
ncbi:MAG TPA: SDR family oxidoreductase [Acidimicrobiales bacterium]|nr:SDR family oxidoreductase [Acidimicrobiales bacterium]